MFSKYTPEFNREAYNDVLKINKEIVELNENPEDNAEKLQTLYMRQIMRGLDLVGYGFKNNGYMPY